MATDASGVQWEACARAQIDAEMVAEVAKLGFDRDMVVDSLRKRQQNKVKVPSRTNTALPGCSWCACCKQGPSRPCAREGHQETPLGLARVFLVCLLQARLVAPTCQRSTGGDT